MNAFGGVRTLKARAVNGQQSEPWFLLERRLAPREFRKAHAWGEDMRGPFAFWLAHLNETLTILDNEQPFEPG